MHILLYEYAIVIKYELSSMNNYWWILRDYPQKNIPLEPILVGRKFLKNKTRQQQQREKKKHERK